MPTAIAADPMPPITAMPTAAATSPKPPLTAPITATTAHTPATDRHESRPSMTAPDHRPRPAPSAPSAPHAGSAAAARALVAAVLALAALAGLAARAADRRFADRAEPLQSLAAQVPSRTWDLAFWSTHQVARTPLWFAAIAYCLDRGEAAFPGCTAVRLASWWRSAASAPQGAPAVTETPAARGGRSAGRATLIPETRP
jgi:hypothetical protein